MDADKYHLHDPELIPIGLKLKRNGKAVVFDTHEGNQCGLCVDPLDPKAIAEAIDYLVANPQEAERMGRNGRKAVQEQFNWGVEEQKLLRLFDSLTN